MKKTYVTRIPDKAGAFLKASETIANCGGNITRVNYNKAVDMHTLFIDVCADEEGIRKIDEALSALGYLSSEEEKKVLLIVLTLEDVPGAVVPVLKVINRYNINVSYISSYETGTKFQYFKMGLLIEDTNVIKSLLDDISKICEVKILDYDITEKILDSTVFYISFANEIRAMLSLSQEETNEIVINANRIMQLLDDNGKTPFKTFNYIREYAKFISEHHGENFDALISQRALAKGAMLYTIEPPCGSNTHILERNGEYLFVDGGFECYKKEMRYLLKQLFPGIKEAKRSLVLTHSDIDHTGLCSLFDEIYLSSAAAYDFELMQQGKDCFREQQGAHGPYYRLSRIISSYQQPALSSFIRMKERETDEPLEYVGFFEKLGLRFDCYEGFGGHVRGEMLIVCEELKLLFTGDIFVNIKGFSPDQAAFNKLAPYLMTSVNVDSKKATKVRLETERCFKGYLACPGHGCITEL